MTINANPRFLEMPGAIIAEIVQYNIEQDFPADYKSPEHFDNSDFQQGVNQLEAWYKDFDETTEFVPEDRAVYTLKGNVSPRGKVRLKSGETLHKLSRDVAERQMGEEYKGFFLELKKNPTLKDVDVMREE
jgi:hypothetical protein